MMFDPYEGGSHKEKDAKIKNDRLRMFAKTHRPCLGVNFGVEDAPAECAHEEIRLADA